MFLRKYHYQQIAQTDSSTWEILEHDGEENLTAEESSERKRRLLIGGLVAMTMFTVVIAVLYFLLRSGNSHDTDNVWINHYATKTAYRNQGFVVKDEFKLRAEKSLRHSHCRPIHVSAVYRHGSRNPSVKEIKHILELHQRFVNEASMHRYLPSHCLQWNSSIPLSAAYNLTAEGRSEHHGMGHRMQKNWGSQAKKPCHLHDRECHHFPPPRSSFNLNNTRFYSSSKARSFESGENFILGLLGDAIENNISWAGNLIKEDDPHMRFFDTCTAYVNKVKHNATIKHQVQQFDQSAQMNKLIKDVRHRFHIPDSFHLSAQDVDVMFAFCATEEMTRRGLYSKNHLNDISYPSPWCAFFTDDERQIWEYKVDLKNYWIKSYPYNISFIPSCILLDRMKGFLEDAMISNRSQNQTDLRGTFSFGHAETVIPLLTVLGLFKDQHQLTAFNYEENRNRKFRTDVLSPMAVNLAFVLHECSPPQKRHSSDDYEYRLQIYLNELPLEWPAFPGRTDITMKEFLHQYSFCWSKSFNFNQTCFIS